MVDVTLTGDHIEVLFFYDIAGYEHIYPNILLEIKDVK